MIYMDNAATTINKPTSVGEAMIEALHTVGNPGRGAHKCTLDASRIVYDTRVKLANFFNIKNPSRIAFTCNATEGLNIAINGILEHGDHVISTVCEHNSVLRPLYLMEKHGIGIDFVSADKTGILNYEDFQRLIKSNTKAIVINHASNLTGNITDLERISRFTMEKNILLVVDAAQTAGIVPIDVEKLGIDILVFTGHKGLLGPQGTGGIYVSEGIDIRPLKVGGSGTHSYLKEHPNEMPTALEAGTLNTHGIAGLGAALSYIGSEGIDNIRNKEMALVKQFLEGISDLIKSGIIKVYGNPDLDKRIGIVSLNIGEYDSAQVGDWLWEDYDICVRCGAHCAPKMHEALGTVNQGAVRFSFSHFNTSEEVEKAVYALHDLAMQE
jgi:cysteine desulfurase family protein